MDNIIKGVYAASLTPLNADLSCDIPTMAAHCKDLMHRGCHGIVIFGTTGEGTSFSVEERKKALRSLVEAGLDPQKLIFGIGCCAITDAVELAQESLRQKCAAVLMLPPFYFMNLPDEGVIAFYREVIGRVNNPDLRIILYHIPQLSAVPITLPIIKTLSKEFPDQVIGIKESEGNMQLVRDIRQQFPNFKVFVGSEAMITDATRLGASGCIVGMANAFPELIRSLFDYGNEISKVDENPKMTAIRNVIRQFPFIPALKCYMEKRSGSEWKALRPPLLPLEAHQRDALEKELTSCLRQLL